MDRIEQTLRTRHATLSRFVKAVGIWDFLRITRIDKDEQWTEQEMAETADYHVPFTHRAPLQVVFLGQGVLGENGLLDLLPDGRYGLDVLVQGYRYHVISFHVSHVRMVCRSLARNRGQLLRGIQ